MIFDELLQRFDLENVAEIMRHTNRYVECFMQHLCDQMVVLICKMFFTDLGINDILINESKNFH